MGWLYDIGNSDGHKEVSKVMKKIVEEEEDEGDGRKKR